MLVTELYTFNLICENLLAALYGVALINVEYIDIIHKNDVFLSNGDYIPLSRLYHNAVVKAYTSYMTGR